jgi:N-carbamoyl-L-amino-acid hydrolase
VRDASDISVGNALDKLNTSFPDLPRKPLGFPVAAYLELHIEQGPVLEASGNVIGIVNGIQGKKTFKVTIEGSEGHAGTLAQKQRRDAVAAFARMATALDREIGSIDTEIKFTIGLATVEPNAPSVVPSRVVFSIDLRHPDNAALDAAGERVVVLCRQYAPPCIVTVTPLVDAPSNEFDARLRGLIGRAAQDQGQPAHRHPFRPRPRYAPSCEGLPHRDDLHPQPGRRKPCRTSIGGARPCCGGRLSPGAGAASARLHRSASRCRYLKRA